MRGDTGVPRPNSRTIEAKRAPETAPPASQQRSGAGFEGHVDFHGTLDTANGWFVGGWVSQPWVQDDGVEAEFADGSVATHVTSVFYHRADVVGRGIGFIAFLRSASKPDGPLRTLRLTTGAGRHTIQSTPDARPMNGARLVSHVLPLLDGGDGGPQTEAMRRLLTSGQPVPLATGPLDAYGYNPVAGGWFLSGWVSSPWPEMLSPGQATVSFASGDAGATCIALLHERDDLPDGAMGLVLFLQCPSTPSGPLLAVALVAEGWHAMLSAAPGTKVLEDPKLASTMRALVLRSADPGREALLRLLARQPYRGEDTLASLHTAVFLGIDEAIAAGPTGLILMGWLLAQPGALRTLQVRSGAASTVLDLAATLRTDRVDVVARHADQGFTDPGCGFVAFLPGAVQPGEPVYIEVQTAQGAVGYHTVPPRRLEGLAAIKRLLAAADLRFDTIRPAFDTVLGPAVAALNQARLASPPAVQVTEYGQLPRTPRCSVVIPLYGRLDYVDYQLALFSAHPAASAVEFIYVLDDPARRREAHYLFASAHERFALPFKAVLLDANAGFAPASNAGLRHATGEFVVFMNSDVFPGTPDWLEQLTARLEADPGIGVIGPVLLYEDGTVQHQGMNFERLPEFGDLYFGMHPGKGLRPALTGLETPISITGACMVLRRALAEQLGGFDESYVIGDFEDSDLCLRLQALGYRCAVDTGVQLFHLERKSQAGSELGWRMNLTVYNAWHHHRRWAGTIAALQP